VQGATELIETGEVKAETIAFQIGSMTLKIPPQKK